jgi:hypothetical protein
MVRSPSNLLSLACIVAIATLELGDCRVTRELARLLCSLERPGGGWPPGAGLRVTEPDCYEPWVNPRGHVYQDIDAVFTTATVLRALVMAQTCATSNPNE